MFRQRIMLSGLLLATLILTVQVVEAQTTRTYTRADFINVEGANLNDKIERAVQQFKSSRQGDSCWLAYHFQVRENAGYGLYSGWNYSDGDGIRLVKRDDPAGAALLLLAEVSGGKTVFTRAKTLNLNEPYTFENRPIYWLGNVEAGQSLAHLESLLRANQNQTGEQSLKRSLLRVISYHDSPRVVPLLEEVVQKEQIYELQRAAIASLGGVGTRESLDALDKLFNNASIALKREIVRAYRYGGDRANEQRVLDRLTAIAKSSEAHDVRAEAVRRIAGFRGDAVTERLFEVYDTFNETQLKREILQHIRLEESRNDQVVKRLVAIAKSGPEVELQRAAVRRLNHEYGENHLNALIEIYDSASVDAVKEEVIARLARSESQKAVNKLQKIAQDDPSPRLRQAAIRRLSSRIG